MDVFVGTFAEQLAPYAVQLGEQLKNTFMRMMSDVKAQSEANGSGDANYDEASDKTMAAMGVMQTVTTLIISLDHSPEIVAKLEEAVLPIVRHVLEEGEIGMAYDSAL
ncbi:MAG: hypothetical protein BJ554DRAFT_7192 [Olpidium bornovanus]|uniref:Uncharacterized protein n=1 Tax=Olpidium bornovanus TaxID=278681 RepID=A0A8H7ZWM7_9FUNG|nr:MAG: hypothetical protein BJ554DRAFT_7192 [Olpidium bornovanus]